MLLSCETPHTAVMVSERDMCPVSSVSKCKLEGKVPHLLHVPRPASEIRPWRVEQAPADRIPAGLRTVKLQRLHPDATVATVEALATLHSLRTLEMP